MALQVYQQCKNGKLNLEVGRKVLKKTRGSGRLATTTTEQKINFINNMAMHDRQPTTNQVSNAINISHDRVFNYSAQGT